MHIVWTALAFKVSISLFNAIPFTVQYEKKGPLTWKP